MAPEPAARPSGRPHPALLVALAAAVLLLVVWWTSGKSAAPAAVASKPRVAAKPGTPPAATADLDVRLEELKNPRPASGGGNRNPFRFYTPPPAPPPAATAKPVRSPLPQPEGPPPPTGPPPPPPIPLKYIGLMEGVPGVPGPGKVAAFSDCRTTMRAREGEIIAGQYRLVRIGVESVVLEYVDGRGRTTVRMSGQECVGK
jgi:hypothetical protein